MKKIFHSFHNEIDFFFRKHIRFSKKYQEKNELKENLFDHLSEHEKPAAAQKEALYLEKYHLHKLKNNSTRRNYLENLATIELLEKYLRIDKDNIKIDNEAFSSDNTISDVKQQQVFQCLQKKGNDYHLKILDIGSKNWFYVFGQYNFFKYNNFEKEISLTGIEIDAFRIYTNFCTRYDYAQYYSRELKNCRYIVGDFLKHKEKYDYIIWFFPFVTELPLLEWGLPLKKFKPLEMLSHAADSLKSGGKILIVNQDENEYEIQEDLIKKLDSEAFSSDKTISDVKQQQSFQRLHKLCEAGVKKRKRFSFRFVTHSGKGDDYHQKLNLVYQKENEFKSSFLDYEHKRFVSLIKKLSC